MKTTPLSFSGLETLRRCPQEFMLAYERGVKQLGYASPLASGTAAHEGIQALLRGRDIMWAYAHAEKSIEADRHTASPACQDVKALNAQAARDLANVEAYIAGWDFARKALGWPKTTSIKCEISFELPIRNPETGRKSRIAHQRGRVDGVCDLDGATPYLYELKTTSDTLKDAEQWLRQSLQIPLYWLAMRDAMGLEPLGAVIDVVKKNPVRTRKGEPTEDRTERMIAEYKAHPEKYFSRIVLDYDERRVEAAQEELWAGAQMLRTCRKSGFLACRGARCKGPYGWCRYRQLCWYDDFESFGFRDGFDGETEQKNEQ